MNYKILIYIIVLFLTIYALSSINYEKFIKKNKIIETKILVMLLSLSIAYLVTNFILLFIS